MVAAAATRWATAALLVASGLMSVAASRERWAPACGSWEAPACLKVQDHRYDYLLPSAPWTPMGEAAQYPAIAQVLLAAAVLVLPSLLFRGRPLLTIAAGATASLSLLVLADSVWASARAGEPVTTSAVSPALTVLALAWPTALVVLALLPRRTPERPGRGWRIVVLLVLLMTSPLPQASMAVGPYDTAPWADALAGWLLVLAGCVLWPATARPSPAVRQVVPPPGPLVATS